MQTTTTKQAKAQLLDENQQLRARVAELETTAAHYQLLADNVAEVIWILDLSTQRFTYVSPSVERLRGYTPEEVLTQSMLDVLTPDSAAHVSADLPARIAAFQAGDPAAVAQTHEIEQTCKDGSTVWTEVAITLMRNAAGGLEVLGVSRDISDRKQAEVAAWVSLEKYRVLFESFPLGITIADAQGQIIESNPEAERLLGLSPEAQRQRQIDGKEWRIIRPDGTPMPPAEFPSVRALQEQRVVANVEMGLVKDENVITWINVTATPIPLEGYGVAITYNDISERKRTEKTLREQDEMLWLAYAAADLGIWKNDLRTGQVFFDERARRHYGFETLETTLDQVLARVHPEDVARLGQEIAAATGPQGDGQFATEYRVTHSDGSVHWLAIQVRVYFEGDGAARRSTVGFGTSQDVTERKQAEEALRQRTEELAQVLDLLPAAVWITNDPECYDIRGNRYANDLLHVTAEVNVSFANP